MDLNKAKRFLDKINREFGRMIKNPEDIASIDRDILLDYTRDFYDALLSEEKSRVKVASTPAPRQKAPIKEARTVRVSGPKQVVPKPTPPKPAPVPKVPKKAAPKASTQVVSPPPKPVPPPAPKVTNTPLRTAPVLNASSEVLALFEFGAAKELSEKLVQPVKDIWKAIGLNDRLLYTKQLFNGSQDDMKKTVENLNGLDSLESAKAYLIQTVAVSNNWGDEKRAEFARDFVKTMRRKFL